MGFAYFIFSIVLFQKNIHFLLLYPKHVIKLLGYNLGCYMINLDVFNNEMDIARDWRIEFGEYLENPNKRVSHRTKAQAQSQSE